jgi:HEAT repeat protein
VREQAIFALSQIRGGEGVPLLVSIARDTRRDPEQRRKAVFWLGQSKDPRAMEFLEEILR